MNDVFSPNIFSRKCLDVRPNVSTAWVSSSWLMPGAQSGFFQRDFFAASSVGIEEAGGLFVSYGFVQSVSLPQLYSLLSGVCELTDRDTCFL